MFPTKHLEAQGDPGTEAVCRYMGECGMPGNLPCPAGSTCENIPGIEVGWCCKTQTELHTGSEGSDRANISSTQQMSNNNNSKSNILVENRYQKLVNKPNYSSKPIPKLTTITKTKGQRTDMLKLVETQNSKIVNKLYPYIDTRTSPSVHKPRERSNILKLVESRNGRIVNKLYHASNTMPRITFSTQAPRVRTIERLNRRKLYSSNIRTQCNGTPVGKCDGQTRKKCPPYSECSFVDMETGVGICCRTRPFCRNGYAGACGRNTGNLCMAGTKCKFLPGETSGLCCRQRPETGKCPNGDDGICGTNSKITCRTGTSCQFMQKGVKNASGKCCINNPKEAFCPSGKVGKQCSSFEPCTTGSECRYGFCCQKNSCPKDWVNEGNCNISPGAPVCPKGNKCIDGSCCRFPEVVCPSGVFYSTCSSTKPCQAGHVCRFGNCCRV